LCDEDHGYVLGHTDSELDRLDLQGALYRDITLRALLDGGLQEGMRVLDIGCGSGDVSRLCAAIVGPNGSILGVDRDQPTVEAARRRTAAAGIENVDFVAQDIGYPLPGGQFDALVGRFVLMHQPNPSKTLMQATDSIRSGGVVVMIESNMATLLDSVHSAPESAFYDSIVRWKCRVVEAAAADLNSGMRLRRNFVEAGLPAPQLRLEAPVEGGAGSPIYGYMADSCRSLLPQAANHGIEGFNSEAVETLEHRLEREVIESGGVLVGWPVVVGWSRKRPKPGT